MDPEDPPPPPPDPLPPVLLLEPPKAGKFSFVRARPDIRLRFNMAGGGGLVNETLGPVAAPANEGNSCSLHGSMLGRCWC